MLTDRPRSIDTCRRYRSRASANSFSGVVTPARSRVSGRGLRMPRPRGSRVAEAGPAAGAGRGGGQHRVGEDGVGAAALEHGGDRRRPGRPSGFRCRPPPRCGRRWRWGSGRGRGTPGCASLLPPGEVKNSVSRSQRPAARSASSASSRCAAASGDSPSPSSSPAGISQSRAPIGCRYCLISSTRSCVVAGEHRDGAGVVDVFAHDLAVVVVERSPPDVPHRAVVDDLAAADVGRPAGRRPARTASGAGAASGCDGIRHLEQAAGLLPLERRADQAAEQRVRPVGPGPQFRMRLRADVERMRLARQFAELDQLAARGNPGEAEAGLGELRRGRRC